MLYTQWGFCDKVYVSTCKFTGINDEHLLESAKQFESFKAQRITDGMPPPLGMRVLIFNEVKVNDNDTCYVV